MSYIYGCGDVTREFVQRTTGKFQYERFYLTAVIRCQNDNDIEFVCNVSRRFDMIKRSEYDFIMYIQSLSVESVKKEGGLCTITYRPYRPFEKSFKKRYEDLKTRTLVSWEEPEIATINFETFVDEIVDFFDDEVFLAAGRDAPFFMIAEILRI